MSPIRPPAWMQREARAAAGPRLLTPAPPRSPRARAPGSGGRAESRRIATGLVGLGALVVVMLNLGIYQSARDLHVDRRWSELVSETNEKRENARTRVREYEHHSKFLAGQPHLREWLTPGRRPLSGDARSMLATELERAVRAFGFHSIALFTPAGDWIAGTSEARRSPEGRSDIQRAARARGGAIGGFRSGPQGEPLLTLAVPIQAAGGPECVAVACFEIRADEAFGPLLSNWNGYGPEAGAFLVAKSAHDAVYLTDAPGAGAPAAGDHARLTDPLARAAAMAAVGVESSVEWEDTRGRHLVGVTRNLPEIGWGLVGQMSGASMVTGMRNTVVGLLTLDLAVALLTLAALWQWRRQYAIGLARREMVISRRHAERVQAVFDTAFDAILTFDRTGRVRSVNHAAERLFARPAAEIVDQPLHRILEWGREDPRAPDLPVPGVVCRAEIRPNGHETLPVEFSIGTSGEGEDMQFTAIVRDIRERVEAERKIRAFAEGLEAGNRRLGELNAQLEGASRLKSEFLANTSHELRTPLNGMIGFLQLVLDGMCDSAEEERDFLKQALQCSRHLLGLINDVLDISKIEAGKLSLDIQRVDVQSVFDEVYTMTHVQAAQKGLTLHFEVAPDRALPARGDSGKLKQVLVNLVGNSIKFTPRGSIHVRATAQPELGHVLFEVVDTGVGIRPDRQEVIFEKFTQADGSTTRKFGGTGLGLAISRSLVELMGGVIGVRSEGEGQGTRMFFSLPAWSEGTDAIPVTPEAPSDRIAGAAGGALVLVVEDDRSFRRYLVSLLQASGYRTVEAANAESAWLLACRFGPAVVVTDFAMTCGENAMLRTGWDLAQRMSAEPETRDIPVVFVTGFDHELRERLRSAEFTRRPEFLMKPLDGAALVSRLEQIVGPVHGRPVRVLMADDDPAVGAFVRKVLPAGRFHLELATTGDQCLHILRNQPKGFDVLILDLMMPDVSGYAVLREIARRGSPDDLAVFVLTNYPEPRNEEERGLLEGGRVVEVLPKSSVHDNPALLPRILGWHLHPRGAPGEPEREAA